VEKVMPLTVRYFLATILGFLGLLLLFWRPGPKWWIGVRLPWTFADREIWKTSWVVAGWLCLVMAGAALFSALAFFIALALFIIISLLYPVLLYRSKYGTLQFWKDIGWIDYHPVARCMHCGHVQKLRDEAQLLVAVCEACGLICRSRKQEGRFE
jgi:hypothetical protein